MVGLSHCVIQQMLDLCAMPRRAGSITLGEVFPPRETNWDSRPAENFIFASEAKLQGPICAFTIPSIG